MGQLRRLGTKTVAALHVTDLSFVARPTGHTYLVLGYEHAYDLITCCSRGLMNWCHMMGVPQEKLSLLWNAPSFIPDAAQIDKTMKAREARPHDRPLRVMFIGRFDRQKGLDRLALMVAAANEMRLPIEWRLIGAVIVDDEADGAVLENLGIRAEPSKGTAEELAECYAWADVIVLLSRWEGLPLTILEAMQFGVVVCATAVGSVPEAVEHGKTGFLLPTTTATIIIEGVQILQHLCEDASSLRRLSVAAAKAAQAWSWQQSTGEFLERIEKMLPKNNLLDLSLPRHP
jgi:glycosyltransferase involved in cell wall biosynthesis